MTYVVSSDAEVATLPPGTILRDAEGHAWYRGTGSWVSAGGDGPPYDPEYKIWQGNLPLPARVLWRGRTRVANLDELDSLSDGVIIQDADGIVYQLSTGYGPRRIWFMPGREVEWSSTDVALPADVIAYA